MLHHTRVVLATVVLGVVLLGSAEPSRADQRAWTREVTPSSEGDPYDPHAAVLGGQVHGPAGRADESHRELLPWEWTVSLIRGLAALIR